MNMSKGKLWIAIGVSVGIGIAVLATLGGLNSFQSASRRDKKVSDSSGAQTTAPPNPAHERAALEEQLKKNPNHPPILLRLAEMEREAGRPAGAVPHLRKILDHDPANADARLELGRALYEAGDSAGALIETQRLLKDHPGNVDGLYNLGAMYANQNRIDLARQYWGQAIAAEPNSDSGRRAKDGLVQLGKLGTNATQVAAR